MRMEISAKHLPVSNRIDGDVSDRTKLIYTGLMYHVIFLIPQSLKGALTVRGLYMMAVATGEKTFSAVQKQLHKTAQRLMLRPLCPIPFYTVLKGKMTV